MYNYNYLNFARALVLSAYLEGSVVNFIKDTVRVLNTDTELVLATSGTLNQYKMLKLEEKGIFIVTGTTKKGGVEFAMLHNGNYIAKGNKTSFYKQIKNVSKNYNKDEKLVDLLDEMEDDVWKYFDRAEASGNHYETKELENIYKFGSRADFEKGVKYLTKKEREAYEVFVQHDKIVDTKGNLVDTNGSISILEDGDLFKTEKAIFVMSENGKIYLSKFYEFGKFHHSSFLAGEKVAAAGEIFIERGVIKIITDGSGHYRPSLKLVEENMLKELSNRFYFSTGTNKQKEIKFNHGF